MATICRHHVVACLHGIRQRGIPEQPLLERAGINPALLERETQRIHTDQVARLFKLVQETLNDEFMGFTDRPCKVGLFATMAELVSHSANLGELLQRAVQFYNLVSDDIPMQLTRTSDTAELSFRMSQPTLDNEHFMSEFWLVIWHRFPSWYIGAPIRLLETRFTFNVPAHHAELQVMFPGTLQFNASSNGLIFDAQHLDRPLLRSAHELTQFVENAPADLMTIPGSDSTLEAQIERLIKTPGSEQLDFPGIARLAARLGISVQTLHRRLKESGTSYQTIKDDLRRELAIKKLVSEKLSVDEVSALAGFSESRSFTRAFKHWTGLTPREYCRQNRSI